MSSSNDHSRHGPDLTDAYYRMLGRLRTRLEELEEDAEPVIERALANARETASELGELSREEAERVAGYLQRDLQSAAQFIGENGSEIADWLRLDLRLVEQGLADMFLKVADRTRLELERLSLQAGAWGEWHTGEVVGPGTLGCKGCGEELRFERVSHIPPCPRCHGTRFRRVTAGS